MSVSANVWKHQCMAQLSRSVYYQLSVWDIRVRDIRTPVQWMPSLWRRHKSERVWTWRRVEHEKKKQPIWHFHLKQFVYLMTQMVSTSNCSLIIHPVLHVFVSFFLCSMYLIPEHICTQSGCYRQYRLYSNDGSQKEEVQS